MLIDSHAHITYDPLFDEVEAVIERAKQASIDYIVNICTDQLTAKRGLELSLRYPCVVNVGATTPHDVHTLGKKDFPFFEKLAEEKKLVAIGETGLDYFYKELDRDLQKKYLLKYFDLAKRLDLPIVIHCREAFEDLFSLTDTYYKSSKLLLHCFTGGPEEAKKALDRGFLISISGIVTFKKSTELQEVVKHLPLDSLVLETDSPYLAPQSKRGKQNEPSYIVETAKYVANLKGVSFEEVCQKTSSNIKTFFQLGNKI